MSTVHSSAVHVVPMGEWHSSAFSIVEQERVGLSGPAMAYGPAASPAEPLPARAGVVVVDLLAPVRHVLAIGLGDKARHLATSPHADGAVSRLTLRLDDASQLRLVMLCKTVPGQVDLAISGAEVWTLDPGHAAVPLLRPAALTADADWDRRAYGLPQSDDELVRWLVWSGIDAPTPVAWWSGTRIILYPGETLSRAIAQSGTYEPGTAVMLKRLLPRGGVFVDAGANSGIFTLPASRWVGRQGRVVAVEPSPREVAKLRANVALNDANNVTVVEDALGKAAGRGTLLIGSARDAGLNTLGPALAHGATGSETREVAITTLDHLCAELKLDRLDVLKADIEGGEHDLLLGGKTVLERLRPAIVMEVEVSALDAAGHDVGDVEVLLDELDYRCFALNGDGPPRFLESLAGFTSGNILAIPAERSEDLLRDSADAQKSARQEQLAERRSTATAEAFAEQRRIRETFQLQAAAMQLEAERLRQEVQQLRETVDAQRDVAARQAEQVRAAEAGAAIQAQQARAAEMAAAVQAEQARAAEAGFAAERAALEACAQEQAAALDEAHHAVHQLESRTRQQRSALDDVERELEAAHAADAASGAALASEREETARLEGAIALLQAHEDEIAAKLAAAETCREQAAAEYRSVHAQQEARAAAVDRRVAAMLKTLNTRHAAAIAEIETRNRRAAEAAEQDREAALAERETARRRADGLANEAATLRAGLHAASTEAHHRAREIDALHKRAEHLDREARERTRDLTESRAWAEHLDGEVHERERRLQAAGADPFGFLVKRLGYYRYKRKLIGFLTQSDKDR